MADMNGIGLNNPISENLLIREHVKPCKISAINDIHYFTDLGVCDLKEIDL